MSNKRGLGRLCDRLTPEERFRVDVSALARGDEEESERLVVTYPLRDYTMRDRGFAGRWEALRGNGQGRVHTDVAGCLDKVRMMEAFGGVFPCLRVVWQDDVHRA